MTIKLHVGYVGKTRDGQRVEIVDHDGHTGFLGDNGKWYGVSGLPYYLGSDIIAPWVDAPAATAPDYNNGEWWGWNGGHRPVHHESVIDVCLKTSGILTGVKGGHLLWSSNIVAFCVVAPYVEPPKPHEWWMCRLRNEFKFDLLDEYPSGEYAEIIHVREVLDT